MKASWPYFFLMDVSWTLSSCHSHVQVQRWRRIDENDARRGFTRMKTTEKILQLDAVDEMNWPPRAEDLLYPGSLENDNVVSSVSCKSQCLQGIFWMDFCLFSHRFELCSRVNNLRNRHISKTHGVSRVFPEPGTAYGACIWCFLPVTRWDIACIP